MPFSLFAQAPAAKPDASKAPDAVIFINGEQLTGEFESADSDGITFKSPMVGEIKVAWKNIKELRSDKNFALLSKGEKLTRSDANAAVPQGSIKVEDKNIEVATASGQKTVPVANADRILDAKAFEKALNHPPGLLDGWAGAATGGVSLVRSTQDSTTFNGAINLTRATPGVDWLPPRNRSIVAYDQSYGSTSQPGTDTVKTNIFHAQGEQDQYFSQRLFGFGSVTFDHDFSQSLDLQQAYGGGVGITLVKNALQELDVKGDLHYEKESFIDPTQNQNLVGSTFSENYLRHLPKGILFNEFGSVSPSWNVESAYSAHTNANIVFPVYKGFGFDVGGVDDYLNNAPLGSKKNSVQFTTGITYTIKPR